MKALLAVILASGIAIGLAPPAAADQSTYLSQLQPKLAFLSSDQLLTEGYKVCRYVNVGRPAGDAIPMVTKDLKVSVADAYYIVPEAVEQLTC